MIEIHFSGLTSQSNIYGLAPLTTADGLNKILVASRERKVYCIEYSRNETCIVPSMREVQFTYIPGGAEIISIDAFNKSAHNHDFLVGITFVKLGDMADQIGRYFNIYSEWQPIGECNLDNIAQGCFTLNLEFMPYHLTHDEVIMDGNSEIVWLLTGGDNKVHMYKEDKSHQYFCEVRSSSVYPEFNDVSSIINWVDIVHLHEKRLTAFGTQEGQINVSVVSISLDPVIEATWSIQHDSQISAVRLFTDRTFVDIPNLLRNWKSVADGGDSATEAKLVEDSIHLAVGSTLEVCVVYRDVLKNGLNDQVVLYNSDSYDCVTCICIADVDMDGYNEILVGTYGQEVLTYKWIDNEYVFQWNHSFPYPVLSISYMDITGDGLKEMLVLSTKGLHIMQHDLKEAMKLCIHRMQSFLERLTDS